MYSPAPLDTRQPITPRHTSPGGETPSTTTTTTMPSTTSSSDVGRTLAFAVAECVLDEVDEHVEPWIEDGEWDRRVLRESAPSSTC